MKIGEGVIHQGRTQPHSTIVDYCMVLASLPKLASRRLSPHIRESKTILDSGFHAVDSGFQVLDSRICQ